MAMVMKEKADRRPAYVLIRGAYDNLGEQVERDTPAFLPPMKNRRTENPYGPGASGSCFRSTR